MFDEDDTGDYTGGDGGQMASGYGQGGQNEGNAGQEEEYKGTVDFDKVPLQEKNSSIVTPADLNQALTDAIGMYGYPNIGTDVALGVRTVFASVPYFLGIITNTITEQLQSIVDQQIFLISALAQGTQFVVQLTGDVLVAVTQAVARAVGYLTGAGTIPPSDPPLPAPPADSVWVPALSGAALV
jgi:hypothetical protein